MSKLVVLNSTLPLEKEMQVVAQSREVSADERKLCSSRQAAQMPKTSVLYIYLVHVHVHTCWYLANSYGRQENSGFNTNFFCET